MTEGESLTVDTCVPTHTNTQNILMSKLGDCLESSYFSQKDIGNQDKFF